MGKRKLVKNFSNTEIRRIANWYIGKDYATFEHIASRINATSRMVSNILYRGIAEDILSDSVAEKVYDKIVHSFFEGQYQRRKRWEKAFDERDELRYERRKAKERKQIEDKIEELKFQIESYESYSIDDSPTLEQLQSELKALQARL